MLLRVTLMILDVVGLSPVNKSLFAKVRYVIYCLSIAFAFVGMCGGAIQYYEGLPTWIRLSDGIPALIQAIGKVAVMLGHRSKLAKGIRSVETFWHTDLLLEKEKADVDGISRVVSRGLALYYLYTFVIGIQFYFTPYFVGSAELPLIFIMERSQPHFTYMYAFIALFCVPFFMSTIAFEGLFVFYTASTIREFRIIRYVFEGKTKEPVPFEENVRHHIFLVGFVGQLRDIYRYLFIDMIVTTFLYICFGLFLMTRNGIPPSLDDFSKYSALVGITSLQIALYCVAGQLLLDESLKIADVFIAKDWLSMKPYKNASGRMMVMRMSQKGQRLSVGGFFGLDLGTYTMFLKQAVSFFTFMQALTKGEN